MRRRVLLDTGPLAAALDRRDEFHSWVTAEWAKIEPPLLTSEAVISEACFLLRNVYLSDRCLLKRHSAVL